MHMIFKLPSKHKEIGSEYTVLYTIYFKYNFNNKYSTNTTIKWLEVEFIMICLKFKIFIIIYTYSMGTY